eukprot:CAMPEP_0197414884 /NCGR_PEP_ID=MMETSP1170-20131217/1531_1 /TAXON_ID=54406 /ORGANISM="Sarcinochrysis sp, Strain CCMP770" /LENGTH=138 /DNA_ID=CAMNT_0042941641 /DNA_START=329 /DNA_END=741 /DNA_ORIENTATION=-
MNCLTPWRRDNETISCLLHGFLYTSDRARRVGSLEGKTFAESAFFAVFVGVNEAGRFGSDGERVIPDIQSKNERNFTHLVASPFAQTEVVEILFNTFFTCDDPSAADVLERLPVSDRTLVNGRCLPKAEVAEANRGAR